MHLRTLQYPQQLCIQVQERDGPGLIPRVEPDAYGAPTLFIPRWLLCVDALRDAFAAYLHRAPEITAVMVDIRLAPAGLLASVRHLLRMVGDNIDRLYVSLHGSEYDTWYDTGPSIAVATPHAQLAVALREWLPQCVRLHTLEFMDDLNTADGAHICDAVPKSTALRQLKFERVARGHAIAPAVCLMLPRVPMLRILDISQMTLPEIPLHHPESSVLLAISKLTALVQITLPHIAGYAHVAVGIAEIISCCAQLTTLCTYGLSRGATLTGSSTSLEPIARALRTTTSLNTLHLGGISNACESMACIFDALQNNATITDLDLANTGGLAAAGRSLHALVASNRTLRRLCIDDNPLAPAGDQDAQCAYTSALTDALARNTTLRELHVMRCITRIDAVVPLVGVFLFNSTLRELFCAPVSYVKQQSPECIQATRALVRATAHLRVLTRNVIYRDDRSDWFPFRRAIHYYDVHVNMVVRLRLACQAKSCSWINQATRSSTAAWLCTNAPLWVVVHVCKLLRGELDYVSM